MNLTENDIKRIRAKKYINTNEFVELYSMSKNSQANYRGRLYHPFAISSKSLKWKNTL